MKKNTAFVLLLARVALLTIVCGFGATSVLAGAPVRFKQVQNLIVASVTVNGRWSGAHITRSSTLYFSYHVFVIAAPAPL